MCNNGNQGSQASSQGSQTPFKVTMTFEGNLSDVTKAIHGPAHDLGQLEQALMTANQTVNLALGELNHMSEMAEDLAFDLAAAVKDGEAKVVAVKEDSRPKDSKSKK